MENKSEYIMIMSTCPDKETAKKIAGILVKAKIAACVQSFPIESVYTWDGEICESAEIALIIKSKTSLFDKLKSTIKENHGYEVPEIVCFPITDGLPEYIKWIDDCTEC